MKFTLSWLKDHLLTDASLDEITYALTDLGLEVEAVTDPAAKLSVFSIGKVIEAEKHPDADKLRICQVQTATGITQIICGAPNARAGITVVIAQPGVYVPGIDITIGVGKIRGVESFGMMCSEREMELSEEHDGIIELDSGEVGQSFSDWLAEHEPSRVDPVIEIAITPNRPDALGIRGIARDLAARGLGTLKDFDVMPVVASFKADLSVSIDDNTLDGCPVFCGRVIRGVRNGPSPTWLQHSLRAIGLRPISFLVDVTNFFTMDRNRPLHVFDADKLTGNMRVHRAQGGEKILALDDKIYTFEAGQMMISDENGAQSIAGIMGGADTGCTEETVNVLVESAYWDPVQIAYTGRALQINSDARYRFERGVDPEFTPEGLEYAVRMIVDNAGGEASELIQAGKVPNYARAYRLDVTRVASLVGMDIPERTQRATLTDLGFRLEGDMAHVPSWRPDVMGEADLVEEIARIASLTKLVGIPFARVNLGVPKPVLSLGQTREQTARRTIASLGYNECVTYSFIDHDAAVMFGGGTDATMLSNPISSEMSHMRPSLLPGLLQAAARNQARGIMDMALFEVGPIWHGGEPEDQEALACGILVGQTDPKDVHSSRRTVDVYDVKADVEAVLHALGAPTKVQFQRGLSNWWHPGRSARMALGKTSLAGFGEVHPTVLAALGVRGPVMAFAIHTKNIPMPKTRSATRPALSISDLQAVERDFAFVVDQSVEAITLVNAAKGADKVLIEEVQVFDEFIGGSLAEGLKSLAFTVRLQPKDTTLKDLEIEAVSAKIVEKVSKATGGKLRS
jgi:phenylalanyl-tRNA synthetase beta chain|tara:strand:+ start:440 stop:2833 length:2394 start_codon:yes stop_codon:yes gene_type:complete